MIVSKTPLRISFFGGGSDIPQFYSRKPGRVLSTSINRHIMIALNRCETDHVRVVYSELEKVLTADRVKHDRVRHALQMFDITSNIEIASFSDVPTKGTGLGSSSTFTVGLLKGLMELREQRLYNKTDLAELACHLEINLCEDPIGKQDQYAAAFGGFNLIEFDSSGVEVTPVNIGAADLHNLRLNLVCLSTGIVRSTATVLADQVKGLKSDKSQTFNNTAILADMTELAFIHLQKRSYDDFGAMLNEAWFLKKKLAKTISNPAIDEMYDKGLKAGALGGKLLGAGGGGYMLFYVPGKTRAQFAEKMREYKEFKFDFSDEGSRSWMI